MSNDSYVAGSSEYLSVPITADVELDTQPVRISIDHGATWLDCTWQGTDTTTTVNGETKHRRTARTDDPVTFSLGTAASLKTYTVLAKVTDNPEVPVLKAGSFNVIAP